MSLCQIIQIRHGVLLHFLSLTALVTLRATQREIEHIVNVYLEGKFTLHPCLRRFIARQDLEEFRFLMARTGMFIGGEIAAQFFVRHFETRPRVLDLYVERPRAGEVVEWLKKKRYRYVGDTEHHFTSKSVGIASTSQNRDTTRLQRLEPQVWHRYVARFKHSLTDHEVQIHASEDSPLYEIISAPTTFEVNIISFNAAYCMFPRATIDEQRGIVQRPYVGDFTVAELEEHRNFGHYHLLSSLTDTEALNPRSSFPSTTRFLGDSLCFQVNLQPFFAEIPINELEGNFWDFGITNNRAYVLVQCIVSPLFPWSICVAPSRSPAKLVKFIEDHQQTGFSAYSKLGLVRDHALKPGNL